MLSVRNLAKIAKRQKKPSALAGRADAQHLNEGPQHLLLSKEILRSTARASRVGNRQGLHYQSLNDSLPAALANGEETNREEEEEEENRRCICPSPAEMYIDAKELLREWRRAGVHYLIAALVFIYAMIEFLKAMYIYLVEVMNVDVPKLPNAADIVFNFANDHPVLFLVLNFGIAFVIGALFLFLEDIKEWMRERRQARLRRDSVVLTGSRAAEALEELRAEREAAKSEARSKSKAGSEAGGKSTQHSEGSTAIDLEAGRLNDPTGNSKQKTQSTVELQRQLRRLTDEAEELEIKTRVLYPKKNTSSPAALEARAELKAMQQQRDELRLLINGINNVTVDPVAEAEQTVTREPSIIGTLMGSAVVASIIRSSNGVMSVSLYFADLLSDLQVAELLYNTGNMLWAGLSVALLCLQFMVVQLRVMPYLQSTHGSDSVLYRLFVVFGFPTGLLVLDALMFLEPFGLLVVLPFPDWLRQFLPAYKATRIIAEVVIESLPQCFLQSYIYIVCLQRAKDGTASPEQMAMLEYTAVLPTSIFISTVAMLKMWIEVVNGAQAAGLSIQAKAIQLWEVGAGLPLDALKKGAIVEWSCPYLLEGPEIPPLLDALSRNASLVKLDLSRSGLIWSGPQANGIPLLEHMSQSPAVLSGLKELVISDKSRFHMPVGRLRRGGESALDALREAPFFVPGGPWREEVLFIGELMRRNINISVVELAEEAARERVINMLSAASKGKLKREMWEKQLYAMIIDGVTRRGHLQTLITAQALRHVGYTAGELLATGFVLAELRAGGFSADGLRAAGLKAFELKEGEFNARELREGGYTTKECRSAGFSPMDMRDGGFTALQLKEVGLSALELQENGFSAAQLREGTFPASVLRPLFSVDQLRYAGFVAKDMKDAGCTLKELADGRYNATDLRNAGYYCSEMKLVDFTIAQLRTAGYSGQEMRLAGFSASQMKAGSFTAKKVRAAGYSAAEAIEAGWSVEVLKAAGYEAAELRDANCPAVELNAVGFTLSELREAGYGTKELQDIGYGAEELRAAGVKLAELTEVGATVAQLKEAGISVIGLKAEGMPLAELKAAGYRLAELKSAGFSAHELRLVGYTATELTEVGFTAQELRACGYSAAELSTSGCTVKALKDAGFSVAAMKKSSFGAEALIAGGYMLKEMREGGFSAAELRAADTSPADMRAAGFTVRALKQAGCGCKELSSAGYTPKELYADGEGFSPDDLKEIGLSAKVLRAAGLSTKQLVEVGFVAKQLSEAGYKAKDFVEFCSLKRISALGFTLAELKQAGFQVKELRQNQFTTKELHSVGFTYQDLMRGGISPQEMLANGATVKELKDMNYSVADLRAIEVTVAQLKSVGYSPYEMKDAGIAAKAMELAGYTAYQLREVGFSVMEIKNCGLRAASVFSLKELKEANFPLGELKVEGESQKGNRTSTVGLRLPCLSR